MPPDNADSSAVSTLFAGDPPSGDLALKASVLDALTEAVIATDESGRIIYWNEAATRLYGWCADEVIGSNILDITPADSMRHNASRIMAALRRGETWTGEFHTRHRDGTEFWVVVNNSPLFGAGGELVGMVGTSRNISGSRAAETALQVSEERLSLVRRAAQSVIWELDPVTRRFEWNSALGDLFGYQPDVVEPTHQWWLDHVHPDDRARLERAFEAFLEDDTPFWTQEYRFRRADGAYAEVLDRAYAAPGRNGDKSRIAGAMVDLTQQRRLQDERRLLAQAGMILDLSLDYEATLPTLTRLVTNVMADFCLVQLMPGAHGPAFTCATHADPVRQSLLDDLTRQMGTAPPDASILGRVIREREPLLLTHLPEALHASPASPDTVRDLVLQLDPTSLMILPVRARFDVLGFLILGSSAARTPFDKMDVRAADELARRIGSAIDHARLYEAEQLANRAKADFLAVMSHELRTPLTAVLGYAELLGTEVSGPLNDRQKQHVQRIRAGTDRLHGLMESILMYVRLETGQERPTGVEADIHGLLERVREIVEPRAREESLEFRLEKGPLPERIITDPDRFLQVLLALLTNALKFARKGTIVLRAAERDGRLEVEVIDNGPGIPEEHQPYVFNSFWQVEQPSTRRAGGAGLGLSVARRLARLLGGDVVIARSSPSGTAFRFTLPIQPME